MRWRLITIIAAAFVVASGTGAAGTLVLRPVTEQLVEGHTVFTVIQNPRDVGSGEDEYAAAVAVLVRDSTATVNANRFAGVLWFNDQYLVAPSGDGGSPQISTRYPCTGAILAVPSGAPDPRLGAAAFTADRYVESYHITDPNDKQWVVDKWNFDGNLVWSVALMNNAAGYSTPDDGTCSQNPQMDGACAAHTTLVENCFAAIGPYPGRYAAATGANGYGYPCGSGTQTCAALKYNAVLYFLLEDLPGRGTPKDHTLGGQDYMSDVSGCHYGQYAGWHTDNYHCPDGDDNREGNSHPYNPRAPEPFQRSVVAPHGGSASCDADVENDEDCHATVPIDIYYDVAALPPRTPDSYRVFDVEGRTAPYHCHQGEVGFPAQAGQPYCG